MFFFDIVCIVCEKKFKVVFMENVKNFVLYDNGNMLEVVKNIMNELDYFFYVKVLNVLDYGIL